MSPDQKLVTVIGRVVDTPQTHPLARDTAARYRIRDEDDGRLYSVVAFGRHLLASIELSKGDEVEVTGVLTETRGRDERTVYGLTATDVVALPKSLAFELGLPSL